MVRWHHQLNGHEFEQTPGDGGGQGSLACYSPWGYKELNMTKRQQQEPSLGWSQTPLGLRTWSAGEAPMSPGPLCTGPLVCKTLTAPCRLVKIAKTILSSLQHGLPCRSWDGAGSPAKASTLRPVSTGPPWSAPEQILVLTSAPLTLSHLEASSWPRTGETGESRMRQGTEVVVPSSHPSTWQRRQQRLLEINMTRPS